SAGLSVRVAVISTCKLNGRASSEQGPGGLALALRSYAGPRGTHPLMPELPDIVVYLEALQSRVVGERLERLRIASPFLLRSVEPRARRGGPRRPRPRRYRRARGRPRRVPSGAHARVPHPQAHPHRSATVFRRRERVLGRDPARGEAVAAPADHPAHGRGNGTAPPRNASHAAHRDRALAQSDGGRFPRGSHGVPRGDGGARPVSQAVSGVRLAGPADPLRRKRGELLCHVSDRRAGARGSGPVASVAGGLAPVAGRVGGAPSRDDGSLTDPRGYFGIKGSRRGPYSTQSDQPLGQDRASSVCAVAKSSGVSTSVSAAPGQSTYTASARCACTTALPHPSPLQASSSPNKARRNSSGGAVTSPYRDTTSGASVPRAAATRPLSICSVTSPLSPSITTAARTSEPSCSRPLCNDPLVGPVQSEFTTDSPDTPF